MEATEQQVIDLYCNTTASIMNMGRDIIPSTAVSEIFGCSVYKARKIIKNLISKALGLYFSITERILLGVIISSITSPLTM